jgi:hypothetical protein
VLRDEKFAFNGTEDGVRRTKKYWNGFQKEPVMQYNVHPNGVFDFSLANSPASQHLYLVDIFSYGLQGLDSSLPDPKTPSVGAQSGPSAAASSDQKPAKRSRSGDSDMSGVSSGSSGSFGTDSLLDALVDPMHEDYDEGTVRVTSEMKLYFRKSK